MRNVLAAAAVLLLLASPAYAQLQPVQPQQPLGGDGRSGSRPRMGDTQDCHAEAQRQAEARYPPQRIGPHGKEMAVQNPGQFPAETSVFQECMRRKGF